MSTANLLRALTSVRVSRSGKGLFRLSFHAGFEDVDLAARAERVEAVFGEPPDVEQAAQRPPGADGGHVDDGAVAGEEVREAVLVAERQRGEVEHRVAMAGLGPVEHTGDPIAVGEHVRDLKVAM